MSDNYSTNELANSFLNSARRRQMYADAPVPIKLSTPAYLSSLFQESYNKSTYGLVDQLINGQERYDLSGFEQGTLFDVGTTMMALVLDLPTFFVGGSVAKLGTKGLVKAIGKKKITDGKNQVTKILAQNNARPEYINKVNQQLQKTFIDNGDRLINEAGGLAFISGTHDMLYQKINKDDVNLAQSVNQALLGAASIGLGKFGKIAATNVVGKKAPNMLKATLGTGGEVIGFTQPYTFAEGKLLPSPQDLAHTAAVIGGIKIVSSGLTGMKGSVVNRVKESERKFGNRDLTVKEKKLRDETLERESFTNLAKPQIFFGNEGAVQVVSSTKNTFEFRALDSNVTQKMTKNEFLKQYRVDKGDLAPIAQLDKIITDASKEYPKLKLRTDLNKMSPKQKYEQIRLVQGQRMKDNVEREIKLLDIDNVDTGFFSKLLTFRAETLPSIFGLRTSPFATPEAIVRRVGAKAEARQGLQLLDEYSIDKDAVIANIFDKHGITDGMLSKMSRKDRIKLTEQLETLPDSMLDNTAKKVRAALSDMYEEYAKLDPRIQPFVKQYAMRDLRLDVKDKLTEIRLKLVQERPSLDDALQLGKDFTKDQQAFLKRKLDNEIKNNPNAGVRSYLSFLKEQSGDDYYRQYLNIRNDLNSVYHKTFHNMKKGRDTYIYWDKKKKAYNADIFETDGVVNFLNYANTWGDQVARARHLGVRTGDMQYGRIEQIIRTLENKGDMFSANALTETLIRATGAIETMPFYNYSPKVKNLYRATTNWTIATKIGLGTATLANMTQPMISSLLFGNYAVGIPGFVNTFTKSGRKFRKEAGLERNANIRHLEVLSGFKPAETFSEKVANATTTGSGFNAINRFNIYTSAAVGHDMMVYLNRIAQGKSGLFSKTNVPKNVRDKIRKETLAGQSREAWAKDKLYREYGIVFNGKELTKEQLTRGSIRYSRDTQLLRNHTKELLWMTHPKFRPFVTLKTFPLKQAKFIKDGLSRELSYGNVLPVARLAIAANVGGTALLWAYDTIGKVLSGRDDYDFRQAEFAVDRIAAVGAMGIMGDVLAAEDKMQNLRFNVTPVILSDIEKIYDATAQLINETGDYGIVGAGRRSLTRYSKILGSNTNNLAKRFQSAEQIDGKLKYQKTRVNKEILEAVYAGEKKKARILLNNWNEANPDYPILEPSVADIYELVRKKQEKRSKELQ